MDLAGGGSFWQGHTIAANFATDGILVLAAVFGLDRILAARTRRRWRPLGLLVAEEFDLTVDLPEVIACRVGDYCKRTYGTFDVPEEMRDPEDIVPAALDDPETWWGEEPEGVPDLVSDAERARDALEERIARWAPVMIVEPELAAIAVSATRLLPAMKRFVSELRMVRFHCHSELADENRRQEVFADFFRTLDKLPRLEIDLWDAIALYRTGQPLQPWDSEARVSDGVA